jgi:hypothetical protein
VLRGRPIKEFEILMQEMISSPKLSKKMTWGRQ